MRSFAVAGLGLAVTAAFHVGGQSTKFFHHKYLAFLFPFVCLALAELGGFPVWNLVEDLQSGLEALRRGWRGLRSETGGRTPAPRPGSPAVNH